MPKIVTAVDLHAAAARLMRVLRTADFQQDADESITSAEVRTQLSEMGASRALRGAALAVHAELRAGEAVDYWELPDAMNGLVMQTLQAAGANGRFSGKELAGLDSAQRALYALADELQNSTSPEAILERWADLRDPVQFANEMASFVEVSRLPFAVRPLDDDGVEERLRFRDPLTRTYGVYSQTEGEGDARLWVYDSKGKLVGRGDWADDGSPIEWN